MKKLILLLSLLSSVAFGLDKIVKAPSGKLILDASTTVQSNKQFNVDTIGEKTATAGVNIVGRTNSAAPSSGYVGYFVSSTSTTSPQASGGTCGQLTLNKGNWLVMSSHHMRSTGSYPITRHFYEPRVGASPILQTMIVTTSAIGEYVSTSHNFMVTITSDSTIVRINCWSDNYSDSGANYMFAVMMP